MSVAVILIFAFLILWAYEIRFKDLYNRIAELEKDASSLKDDVSTAKKDIKKLSFT